MKQMGNITFFAALISWMISKKKYFSLVKKRLRHFCIIVSFNEHEMQHYEIFSDDVQSILCGLFQYVNHLTTYVISIRLLNQNVNFET